MRFQRCPSPRWPEAQRDVTVIPGRQKGPRAPGPRATERAKGSQPVYARALSDTLPCSVRFMQQARNVKDPDLLLAARSYQLLPPAHARARIQTLSKFPGRSGRCASLSTARAQGTACSPPPLRPRGGERQAGGEGRENTKEEPGGKWGSQARGEKKEGEER